MRYLQSERSGLQFYLNAELLLVIGIAVCLNVLRCIDMAMCVCRVLDAIWWRAREKCKLM